MTWLVIRAPQPAGWNVSARAIAQASRKRGSSVPSSSSPGRGADPDAVARVDADQRIVHEADALAHRHAQMVHELERGRAGAAFIAVDDDEIGINAALLHRLADRQKLPGVADAHLEAGRLAAGKPAHLTDELHHLQRRGEGAVARRRNAVLAHLDAADLRYLLRNFRRRQHAAMAG